MSLRLEVTLGAAELERERANLERGSLVADGVTGVERGAFLELELVFPGRGRLAVPARAVLTTPGSTIFAFEGFDRAALARLLAAPAAGGARPEEAQPGEALPGEALPDEVEPGEAHGEGGEGEAAHHASVQERLRGLPVVAQLRLAREGGLTERVVLERLYGKTVWEALLRNPHLTVPEVSRLARLGTMPRPLLELIVGNPAWMQVPQVRRALLANPRLSPDMVQRVLALLPRDELKLVPQITAYPAPVRLAAKALVRR